MRVRSVVPILLVLVGCTSISGPGAADDTRPTLPVASVAVPEIRLSPFCEKMAALSERLDDPSVDSRQVIIEAYTDMRDIVPAEIKDDFEAVLAALESGTPVTTGAPDATGDPGSDFQEGYAVPDTPTERLNAYVESTCRAVENNPGPPATPPE